MTDIAENLKTIEQTLAGAAAQGGFKPPRLIAVSKGHDAAAIVLALKADQRIFGENRVQEAEAKWPAMKEKYTGIELHLIGPLQTNKVKNAVALFDVIETVDRLKLARALKSEMERTGKTPKLFVQVNTGEEPQKAGVVPGELAALLEGCKTLGLAISGLMCIPPVGEEPALHFALLKKLAARHGLLETSMGMSGDFQTAAALGASYVRVGTAIFGPRGQG